MVDTSGNSAILALVYNTTAVSENIDWYLEAARTKSPLARHRRQGFVYSRAALHQKRYPIPL